jgi:hypothetical protein
MELDMQVVWFSYLLWRMAATTAVFGESKRVVAAAIMTVVIFGGNKGHSLLFVAYIYPP